MESARLREMRINRDEPAGSHRPPARGRTIGELELPTLLETDRLIIREWKLGDVEAFHTICSDPEVMRFVGDGAPWSRGQTQGFIDRAVALSQFHGFCQWALVDKSGGNLIGFCGFVPFEDGAEIGWRLASAAWGRGLATEAAQAALDHGFNCFGFPRVVATVQPLNRGSVRVIEKLGLSFHESRLRQGRAIDVYTLRNPAARPEPPCETS